MPDSASIVSSRPTSIVTSRSKTDSLPFSDDERRAPPGRAITDVLNEDVLLLVLSRIEELYGDGLISRLDVLSLAKSSKYFYGAALPLIYRTVTFDCHINKAIYEKSWACCSNLARRPHLAALVRSCIIKDSYDFWDGMDHYPKQWKTVITPALTNMINLRVLRWQRTSFSPSMWKLVCSMQRLESLHLQQCALRTPLSRRQKKRGEHVEIPCPPSLKNLTLIDVNMRHGDNEVVLELIDGLLASKRSLSLGVNKPLFWTHLMDNITDPTRLRKLCILDAGHEHFISADLVVNLLKETTELTDLMIYIHSDILAQVMQHLPSDALPNLETFSGNPGVAQEIVPGRRVHTIYFNAVAASMPIGPLTFLPDPGLNLSAYVESIRSLQRSLVGVRHFDMLLPDFEAVAYELPIMQQLPDLLPDLRVFAVHGPYNGAVNNNRLTEAVGMYIMGRLEYLEDFSFHVNYLRYRTTPGLNLKWQHEQIMQWSKLCPTLSAVKISTCIHWRRSLGQWQPALDGQDAWTRLTEGVQWIYATNKDLNDYDWNGTLEGWLGDRRWKIREAPKEVPVIKTLQNAVSRISLRRVD